MKKGDVAKLKTPVVQGEIISTRYNEETLGLEHMIGWTDADGNDQTRWFVETDLEEVVA
jgi:hypothetical protein